ncbi:MAG: RND family transporter, partial [Bizionia paragorgiae]
MSKLKKSRFWDTVARLILRNKIGILITVVLITILFSTQWKYMRFTYTEANLLPDDHEVNIEYNKFLNIFGEEGNLIVLGVKDST